MMKLLPIVACLALIPIAANADAVSDQKKAYGILGLKVPHPPALCTLISKAEAARYLGAPVRDGESAGSVSGCAYRVATDSNRGILVTRDARSGWSPDANAEHYAVVHGVGERAYTDYEYKTGYEATALTAKGVTTVLVPGSSSPAIAVSLLKLAMNR